MSNTLLKFQLITGVCGIGLSPRSVAQCSETTAILPLYAPGSQGHVDVTFKVLGIVPSPGSAQVTVTNHSRTYRWLFPPPDYSIGKVQQTNYHTMYLVRNTKCLVPRVCFILSWSNGPHDHWIDPFDTSYLCRIPRNFSKKVTSMKKLAAQDFEDLLQISVIFSSYTGNKIVFVVVFYTHFFEGFLAPKDNSQLLNLLWIMCVWHALASSVFIHREPSMP